MKTLSKIHLNVCNWWLKNRGSGFTGAIINHRLRSRRHEPHCVTTRHESLTINCVPVKAKKNYLFQKIVVACQRSNVCTFTLRLMTKLASGLNWRWESKRSDEISAWTWVSWSCCAGRSATVKQWPNNVPEISRVHANSNRCCCALLSWKCFCRNFSLRHQSTQESF